MKKLILLLSLITTVAWGSSAIQAPTVGYNLLNLTGINELTGYNPDFELGNATYWTASSGDTLSVVSGGSNLLFNTTSGAYTASASGKFLVSQTVTVPVGLQGGGCYMGIYYKYAGATGDYSVSVDDGSTTLATAVSLPQATSARYVEINYPCGTTSNRLKITSNVASPSTIYIDNAYMGSTKNVGTAQQAQLLGTISWTLSTNVWTATGNAFPTYGDFAVNNSISAPTVTGVLSAPATRVPSVVINNAPAGTYLIQAIGAFSATNNSSGYWKFSDGTNTSADNIMYNGNTAQTNTVQGTIVENSNSSNLTIKLVGSNNSSGSSTYVGGTGSINSNLTFYVYYFPSSAQQAVKVDQTPASWSGYQKGWTASATVCGVTSTTFSDPGACTNIALTETTNRNFGTVTTAAGSLPGIIITPNKTGMYQICASGSLANGTTQTTSVRMVDGSGTIINPGASIYLASNSVMPTICGIYNATAATATTIKLQIASNTGSTSFWVGQATGTGLNWTVTALDQGMAVPFLQGNVTSNTSGQERIERVTFGGNAGGTAACTASPCTIISQSGSWVTSVTRSATGTYSINIASGIFSATPSCTYMPDANGGAYFSFTKWSTSSSTKIDLITFDRAGAASDILSNVICQGAR